jgi:uncharacterized membrane protein YjfL (UPF0719 family)
MLSTILHIAAWIFILGLFFYSKLTPHKARLNNQYLKYYNFFDRIFGSVSRALSGIFAPLQVGTGVAIDVTQFIILILLLLIIQL